MLRRVPRGRGRSRSSGHARHHAAALHWRGLGHAIGCTGARRHRLRSQPRGHGVQVVQAQALHDLRHAVGRMRLALARVPCPQLAIQVVAREPQQGRRGGLHAHQRAAMAGGAGRRLSLHVAAACQLLAALQRARIGGGRSRGRVGQIQRLEVARDVHQVGVVERLEQPRHQAVMAAPVAKVQQLVVQVARRLAGDARVIAVGPGAALLAVAGGAGQHALGHAVFHPRFGGAGRVAGGGVGQRCTWHHPGQHEHCQPKPPRRGTHAHHRALRQRRPRTRPAARSGR